MLPLSNINYPVWQIKLIEAEGHVKVAQNTWTLVHSLRLRVKVYKNQLNMVERGLLRKTLFPPV